MGLNQNNYEKRLLDRIGLGLLIFLLIFLVFSLNSCVNTKEMIESHNWDKEAVEAIQKGYIEVGFTTDMVKASWGNPQDINFTTNANGTIEQWVYSGNYVYFSDGKVTKIQTH